MAEDHTTLKLERVVSDPGESPRVAHKFLYARIGSQVVLEVGFFDLAEIHRAISSDASLAGEPVRAKLYVTARFALSPEAVFDLEKISSMIANDLRKSGNLPKDVAS